MVLRPLFLLSNWNRLENFVWALFSRAILRVIRTIFTQTETQDIFRDNGICNRDLVEGNNVPLSAVLLSCLVSEIQNQ
jgi:hypothetical protein